MGGVFLKIKASENFAIQSELLFMQRGGKVTYSDSAFQGSAVYIFNYVDIPFYKLINEKG